VVRLVLFDIDGTLIRTGGAGVKAFERTFAEVFDLPEATKMLNFAGRTDFSLVRECFTHHGIATTADHFARFFRAYPIFLAALLRELPGGVCEGILEFIEELCGVERRPVIGLLTGNVRRGAELKLRHYGLWERFEFGAFADDHEDRICIASLARQRGETAAGRALSGEEIVVIGDTPLDISCAKSIGAKVLAVGTGNFSREELRRHEPTWAVDHVGQMLIAEVLGR
jgi:phosphoglycolate phosphatase